MAAPSTREELENTTFFKAGREAAERGRKLTEAISMLRFGTWQYDAFISGYDSEKKPSGKKPVEVTVAA